MDSALVGASSLCLYKKQTFTSGAFTLGVRESHNTILVI
jgi:hypothetical protein